MARWWAARPRGRRRREATAAPAASRKSGPSAIRKAQAALVARYRHLKDYFRDPKDGF